jgi:hypothetical protein
LRSLLHAESKQELAKVKIELEKKDSDISKTVNDLSTKLNGISFLFLLNIFKKATVNKF